MKWFLLLYAILCSIGADFAMKNANGLFGRWFAFGMALYIVSSFGWLYIFREASMGWVAVTYSALTVLLLTSLGVAVYSEPITLRRCVALGAALVAIGLAGE